MLHRVSVIAIHGLDDQHVPFAGGQGTKGVTVGSWVSVPQTLELFRNADGCQLSTTLKQRSVQTTTSECEQGREVVQIVIEGVGHQWLSAKIKAGIIQHVLKAAPQHCIGCYDESVALLSKSYDSTLICVEPTCRSKWCPLSA
jgi:poly(3-hydroxybutyrate) depolymerase